MPAEFEDGFFTNGEAAWHGLGTVVEDDSLTPAQVIERFPLIVSNVTPQPLFTGQGIRVPGWVANVRDYDENVVGVTRESYQIFQVKEDIFPFVQDLVDSGVACRTGGTLFDGRQFFFSFTFPGHLLIGGDEREKVDMFILVSSSHDGSRALSVCITPIRVVCNNTLTAALNGAPRVFRLKHTKNANLRSQEVRDALQLSFKYADQFGVEAEKLAQSSFSDAEFDAFLTELVAEPEKPGRAKTTAGNLRAEIAQNYRFREDQQHLVGTKWGAYQAVTAYTTHDAKTRATKGKDKAEARTERRILDALDGNSFADKAWQLLTV